jgi:hypothetical protein
VSAFFQRALLYFHIGHYSRALGDLVSSILHLPGHWLNGGKS